MPPECHVVRSRIFYLITTNMAPNLQLCEEQSRVTQQHLLELVSKAVGWGECLNKETYLWEVNDFLREKLCKGDDEDGDAEVEMVSLCEDAAPKLVGPGAAMHKEPAKSETPPAKAARRRKRIHHLAWRGQAAVLKWHQALHAECQMEIAAEAWQGMAPLLLVQKLVVLKKMPQVGSCKKESPAKAEQIAAFTPEHPQREEPNPQPKTE